MQLSSEGNTPCHWSCFNFNVSSDGELSASKGSAIFLSFFFLAPFAEEFPPGGGITCVRTGPSFTAWNNIESF